jgi:hypothetical protein
VTHVELRAARDADAAAIKAFNHRMAARGSAYRIGLGRPFRDIRLEPGTPIGLERVLCIVDGEVRGGASVKRIPFWVDGQLREVATWIAPITEGAVDPSYALLALRMERAIRQRYGPMYSTGALRSPGGELMHRAGWRTLEIPFHFWIVRAGSFLRNIKMLRRNRPARLALDLLAATGAGSVGLAALSITQRVLGRYPKAHDVQWSALGEWDERVDRLWADARDHYALIGERSSTVLRALYPASDGRFQRLQIVLKGEERLVGWLVLMLSHLRDHHHFGSMTVCTMLDMLAAPSDAAAVLAAGLRASRRAGADLVVLHHSDRRWNTAARRVGMLPGPTNHHLFCGPELERALPGFDERAESLYFTRGDGHGPMHL